MSADSDNAEGESLATLIGEVYAVAVNPLAYPRFVDHWLAYIQHCETVDSSVLEHMEQAGTLLQKLVQTEAGKRAQFSRAATMTFEVSETGTITRLNEAARHAFSPTPAFSDLDIETRHGAELRSVSMRVARGDSDGTEVLIAASKADGSPQCFLVSRIEQSDAASALVCSTSILWPVGFEGVLRQQFGYTRTEVDVVRLLIEGFDSRDIANQRHRSVETVRTQVRKILKKTAVDSQLDLVRLLLGLIEASPSGFSSAEDMGAWERTNRLDLGEGVVIEYEEMGKPDGYPVVYFFDSETTRRLRASLVDELGRRGIRVITPLRAVYDGNIRAPQQLAESVSRLMKKLKVTEYCTLSSGSGLVPALLLAARNQFAQNLLVVGGSLPFSTDSLASINPFDAAIRVSASRCEGALPFLMAARIAYGQKVGNHQFLLERCASAPADLDALEETGVQSVLGSSTVADTTWMIETELIWHSDEFLNAIARMQRVHWLHGDCDSRFTLQEIERFVSGSAGVELQPVSDAGMLLLHSHPLEVADKLAELCQL